MSTRKLSGIALAICVIAGCFSEPNGDDDPAGSSGEISLSAADTRAETLPDGSSTGTAVGPGSSEGDGATSGGSTDGAGTDTGTGDDSATDATMSDDTSTGEVVLMVVDLEPGDLVITEVQFDPHCGADTCEWFEVYNATQFAINLLDLYVQDSNFDDTNQGRITLDVEILPGEYAVLARAVGQWPYVFVQTAAYGPQPILNNSRPDLVAILKGDGTVLDVTPSLPFDAAAGVSWAFGGLDITDVENDDPLQWCLSTAPIPMLKGELEEFGTPFEANPQCAR